MDVSKLAKELTVFCKQRVASRQRSPYSAILLLVVTVLAGGSPGTDKKNFWTVD